MFLNKWLNFAAINSIIGTFSYVSELFVSTFSNNLLLNWSCDLLKTFALLKIMDSKTEGKQKINPQVKNTITFGAAVQNTIITCSLKTLTHTLLISHLLIKDPNLNTPTSIMFYPILVVKSFAFEIIFDFFHYWAHRTFHSNAFLYTYIHKKHHEFADPTAYSSFHMSPLDVTLSYSCPLTLTMMVLPFTISLYEFMSITIYLTYQEIGGHLGKKMRPTSSFCQFIWLPRLLNIELYTEDHHLHHNLLFCNYSKRFALWDKIFCTYKVRTAGPPRQMNRNEPQANGLTVGTIEFL